MLRLAFSSFIIFSISRAGASKVRSVLKSTSPVLSNDSLIAILASAKLGASVVRIVVDRSSSLSTSL